MYVIYTYMYIRMYNIYTQLNVAHYVYMYMYTLYKHHLWSYMYMYFQQLISMQWLTVLLTL